MKDWSLVLRTWTKLNELVYNKNKYLGYENWIFPPIHSLEKLTLFPERQSQSADLCRQIP